MSSYSPESGVPEAAKQLRHELRTPINHIVGFAEMLLEDSEGEAHAARRGQIEAIIGAAGDILKEINTALPPTLSEPSDEDVRALYAAFQSPRERVLASVEALRGMPDVAADEGFTGDLERIREAAEKLAPPGIATAERESSRQATDADRSAENGRARILVVDDDENNREVLRRRLEREGHAPECAVNGVEALERVAESPYDLVLLDVMMPEMDGYETLDRLKGDPSTRDIPVIMISALDDIRSIVRCIENGAEDYLPKPFDPVLLRARIDASLEKKRFRDQEVDYLRQVDRVIEAAASVEAGAYDRGSLTEVGHRADALGRLARVFDSMAGEVRARETRLRTRVRELRQEIDAARGAGTVAEPFEGGQLQAGETFAERYEIAGLLGHGGMGAVYRARDLELEEDVAIKMLRPEFIADAESLERFKTEIKLARRISHPNVVRTHDFGEADGVRFLTMEFVEGLTLRDLIDSRGKLGVSAVLAVAAQLAESLAIAHAQGVVHRDIKPQNLLLDEEGVLKVMDFGVACLSERSSTLTQAGALVGTPAYMSPEQLIGEHIDERSDLYSVGVVLYECLSGRPPLDGGSAITLIAKVLGEEPPPLGELAEGTPDAVCALIHRLLAKNPNDRVPSAAALGGELSRMN
ncbi:MAG: protein kinase [Gemmatimonadota bacterium]|nr:protein kinase [Gemmatimonadota bacterium]